MLTRMRRNHTREAYLELVKHIRNKIPGVALSSDFICGCCDETEEEYQDTLSLLETVQYDMSFLFAYSMREKTHAHRKMQDNVPEPVKKARLIHLIDVFKKNQLIKQLQEIGNHHLVLIDGNGRLGETQLTGLTDTNKRAVLPARSDLQVGDLVNVKVVNASQNTLFSEPIQKMGVQDFFKAHRLI